MFNDINLDIARGREKCKEYGSIEIDIGEAVAVCQIGLYISSLLFGENASANEMQACVLCAKSAYNMGKKSTLKSAV
jgi:L-lactate utilization protein LutB